MGLKEREDTPSTGVLSVFLMGTLTGSRSFLLYVMTLAVLVSMATGGESLGKSRLRYKRNLIQMCGLMSRYTGSGCLRYNNYGCHCGLRSSTATPVDAVDSCCRLHDLCYHNASTSCRWMPSLVTYDKKCDRNGCRCTDSPTRKPCDYNTCQCDLTFAQCLQTATYNRQFHRYNTDACGRS